MEWYCDKISEQKDPLSMSIESNHEWKLNMFKEAFAYHFNNCSEYKKYCLANGLSPEHIKRYEELSRIQPIPSDVFRDSEKLILSVPESEVIRVFTTSGTTSKKPVRFPIDKKTFDRMNILNSISWKNTMELNPAGSMIFLTPDPRVTEVGLVGGAYVIYKHMGFKDESIKFVVKVGKFNAEEVLDAIENSVRPVFIYGPPFAYWHLVQHMKEKGKKLNLGEESRSITTGGWKGVEGVVDRDKFNEGITESFNIKEDQIRDCLGSTDIMGMLPECKYHQKHVPPWYHISARDPTNINEEVPEWETGLGVFMSAFIQSYPAFCMPGDMVAVKEMVCECGRTGQVMEHRGRASKLGARGCAIKLEEFMKAIER
jgi:long-chain-fatty-acid---luciferin-component ligase